MKWVVTARFVAVGDVSSFDVDGVRNALIKLFPDADDVVVTVSAASVNVVARIITDTQTVAESTQAEFSSLSNAQLSQSLGTTVESVTSIGVQSETIAAPSPPSPSPPPSPSQPPLSPDNDNTVILVVSVLIVVIVMLVAGTIVVVRYYRRVRASRLSRTRAHTGPDRPMERGGPRIVQVELYGRRARPVIDSRVSRV